MNKITNFLMMILVITSTSVNAQLANGSFAKNFIMRDLNGVQHNLYEYLDSGKTVIIDVSASWCGPCWSYHNQHHLKALYEAHGPKGAPGVRSTTTNDVVVLYIEGDVSTKRAELYAKGLGTNPSQGDWVTGTPYPIIDSSDADITQLGSDYNIKYFPTIYAICRDRLVYEINQQDSTTLYTKSKGLCPTYGPSATVDAKIASYKSEPYACGNGKINADVNIHNYALTNLTAATIKVKEEGTNTDLFSQPWTGSLATYEIATANLSFSYSGNKKVYYEVIAANDTKVSNNISTLSRAHVYAPSNKLSFPFSEDLQTTTNDLPFTMGYGLSTDAGLISHATNGPGITITDASGNSTSPKVVNIDFYGVSTGNEKLIIGNFETLANDSLTFSFDYAYTQYVAGAENDKIELITSSDCGSTWTPHWNKIGAAWATVPAKKTPFIPSSVNDWKKADINFAIPSASANTLVALKFTSNYGNYAWLDNFTLKTLKGKVINVGINTILNSSITVYPNPSDIETKIESTVGDINAIEIKDITGKTVMELFPNSTETTINTSTLSGGVYTMIIKSNENIVTKQLNVRH